MGAPALASEATPSAARSSPAMQPQVKLMAIALGACLAPVTHQRRRNARSHGFRAALRRSRRTTMSGARHERATTRLCSRATARNVSCDARESSTCTTRSEQRVLSASARGPSRVQGGSAAHQTAESKRNAPWARHHSPLQPRHRTQRLLRCTRIEHAPTGNALRATRAERERTRPLAGSGRLCGAADAPQ